MKRISSIFAIIAFVALSASPAAAASKTVDVQDNSFSPATVTIDEGDLVTWDVSGLNPHNVVANNGSFSSGTLGEGDKYTHVFNTPGTFAYTCTIHGSVMSGSVVVVAATVSQAGSGRGLAETGRHPRRNAAIVVGLMMIVLGVGARAVASDRGV